jgi:hypothetical protein
MVSKISGRSGGLRSGRNQGTVYFLAVQAQAFERARVKPDVAPVKTRVTPVQNDVAPVDTNNTKNTTNEQKGACGTPAS